MEQVRTCNSTWQELHEAEEQLPLLRRPGDPGQAKKTSSKWEAGREPVSRLSHLESREIIVLFIILRSPLYEKMQQSKA